MNIIIIIKLILLDYSTTTYTLRLYSKTTTRYLVFSIIYLLVPGGIIIFVLKFVKNYVTRIEISVLDDTTTNSDDFSYLSFFFSY